MITIELGTVSIETQGSGGFHSDPWFPLIRALLGWGYPD